MLLALAICLGGIVTLFGGLVAVAMVSVATHPPSAPTTPAHVVVVGTSTLAAPSSTATPGALLVSPPPAPTTQPTTAAPLVITTAPPQVVVPPPATVAPPRTVAACGGDTYVNVDGNCVPRPTQAPSAPTGATAQCRDGSYSFSQHRQGTCSGHGGVARWL